MDTNVDIDKDMQTHIYTKAHRELERWLRG